MPINQSKHQSDDATEIKQLQEKVKLLEAENTRLKKLASPSTSEQLTVVLDHLPVMFNALDQNRSIVYWNRECERVTGYTKAEIENNPQWPEILYPDPDYLQSLIQMRPSLTNNFKNVELEVTCKDGSTKTISWSSAAGEVPIFNWSTWAIGIDVTETKEHERRLEEAERRFNALFNYSPEAVFVISLEHQRHVTANQRAADLLGYTIEELSHRGLATAPEEVDDAQNILERLLAGETIPVYERTFVKKDGTRFPVEVTLAPIHDSLGEITQVLSICHDISERKAMVSRLKTQEAWFQAIFASSLMGMIVLDKSKQILEVNQTFASALDYEIEELIERSFLALLNDDTTQTNLQQVLDEIYNRELNSAQITFQAPHKSGELVWFEMMLVPQHSEDDDVQSIVLITKDITLEKAAEERTVQLAIERERLKIITEFVTAASHEFRTPLSRINTNAYLINAKHNDPATSKRLAQIEAESKHILQLIEGLFTIVKLNTGITTQRIDGNINDLMRIVDQRFRERIEKGGIICETDLAQDLPNSEFDSPLIMEMLSQLLDNAIRFTKSGGSVRLQTGWDDDSILIKIHDTGIGIPKEVVPRIFDQFFRQDLARTTPGLGLGMSIAKKIAELHHGFITVESEVGVGTNVIIKLPIEQPSEPELDSLLNIFTS